MPQSPKARKPGKYYGKGAYSKHGGRSREQEYSTFEAVRSSPTPSDTVTKPTGSPTTGAVMSSALRIYSLKVRFVPEFSVGHPCIASSCPRGLSTWSKTQPATVEKYEQNVKEQRENHGHMSARVRTFRAPITAHTQRDPHEFSPRCPGGAVTSSAEPGMLPEEPAVNREPVCASGVRRVLT